MSCWLGTQASAVGRIVGEPRRFCQSAIYFGAVNASVGIDLGTTNSLLAWTRPGDPLRVAELKEGGRLLPSCVYVAKGGEVLVGSPARAMGVRDPRGFFEHFK